MGFYDMTVTDDIRYIGVDDHTTDLFEGQYILPRGMAYNSYVIMDEKIAIMDTVDEGFGDAWISNLEKELGGRTPDYLVVHHMEPDHSANIVRIMDKYPSLTVVSSQMAFGYMKSFYGNDYPDRRLVIKEGDTLTLGKHELHFVAAPMVHWPEVMMSYESTDKVIFSADAFGKFGANDVEDPEGWECEARRYYFGIVGKFGPQVQTLLKKLSGLEVNIICPLHGYVLKEDLGHYIGLYDTWSSYGVETEGTAIFYTSVYGNTKKAAEELKKLLLEKGCPKVALNDLAREDIAECVEDAFRYGKIILATTTYNGSIFPFMHDFIDRLTEHNFCKRKIGFIENGTWAPMAAKLMKSMFEGCKDITFAENTVTLKAAFTAADQAKLDALAEEMK